MASEVSDELVRAKAGELADTLGRWKLDGFAPAAGLDLAAAARLTVGREPRLDTDGTRLIIAGGAGRSEFTYAIHLSATAVSMIGSADFKDALGAALADLPDLAGIVQPLLSFITLHSGEITAQTGDGPIRLEGTVPSPFVTPVAEDSWFWDNERKHVQQDARAAADQATDAAQAERDAEVEQWLQDQDDDNGKWDENQKKYPWDRKRQDGGL
ncbi:hypothetical protein ACIP5Y_26580 [Nocardia sp. NPDC088792]|uniref:hypothetical protein n=1 Tax=Nocardia sp. NPDC088792 TaxID=3364332 RepID=UPI00382BD64E